ncbi:MAG: hypothetical protein JW996_02885 [Candidatus Cloacimonetes bacterium]|nr:hypothetical protein [Candidatus Cloacimonadota bacterium]
MNFPKNFLIGLYIIGFSFLVALDSDLAIKGFYLGMDRETLQSVYSEFEDNGIADYLVYEDLILSDQITIDNDMNTTDNKIEVFYDVNGKAELITFQSIAVDILFDVEEFSVSEFIAYLQTEFSLPEMKPEVSGDINKWSCEFSGSRITVDQDKNLSIGLIKQ